MKEKTKGVLKKVGNIATWVVLGLAIALAALALISRLGSKDYPVIGKYAFFSVQTNSMEGENGFKEGSLIICRVLSPLEKTKLEKNDVITFFIDLDEDGDRELNTHRIVDIELDVNNYPLYITKGDHKPVNDTQHTPADDVECIWTGKKINGLGKVLTFIQSSTGFLVCIVIPMGIFLLYELIAFVFALNDYKNKKRQDELPSSTFSKEEEELIKQKAIEEYLAKQKAENSNQANNENTSSEVIQEEKKE